MIAAVIDSWHRFLTDPDATGLDDLLADDVVFYSPVVYTPQRGKQVTALYLHAAKQVLPGGGDGTFRYTKQVVGTDTAVLEFETTVDGTYVNGVDIIRCSAAGKIVEFRVMLRPLQAVNAVHDRMRAMLASLQN
jgi:ketosteroid isomerase-like protein